MGGDMSHRDDTESSHPAQGPQLHRCPLRCSVCALCSGACFSPMVPASGLLCSPRWCCEWRCVEIQGHHTGRPHREITQGAPHMRGTILTSSALCDASVPCMMLQGTEHSKRMNCS